MNVVYFGDDFFINCLHVLRDSGHKISYIFTGAEKEFSRKLHLIAATINVPISTEKVTFNTLQKIISDCQIDLVFSAGYAHKINFDYDALHSINVHPTLLPTGRGPDAMAWIPLKYREAGGISFHKISEGFDEGDILLQKPVAVESGDGWEMYMAKLQVEATRMLSVLMENLSRRYSEPIIQTEGCYWPATTVTDRLVSWEMPHRKIYTIVKAFGRWGAVVLLGKKCLLFNDIELSPYTHSFPAGEQLNEDFFAFTIATSEGIALLQKRSIIREIDEVERRSLGIWGD